MAIGHVGSGGSDTPDWDASAEEAQHSLREYALKVIERIKKAPQTWEPMVGTQPLPDAWEDYKRQIQGLATNANPPLDETVEASCLSLILSLSADEKEFLWFSIPDMATYDEEDSSATEQMLSERLAYELHRLVDEIAEGEDLIGANPSQPLK